MVDAHHYFVVPSHLRREADELSLHSPEELALLLRQHGVMRTVVAQANPSEEDTVWTLSAAGAADYVAGAVVWSDVQAANAGELMDGLASSPKLRGLCLPVWRESDNHWLVRDDVLRGMQAAAERGLSVDLLIEPRQLPSVRRLAEALPELRIALGHIGSPSIARGEREPWGVQMLNLAPHENVVVKLSGLVTLDAIRWNVAHIRPFVESVVRLFGHERVMFGSDWPVHLPVATYGEVLEAAAWSVGPIADRHRELLFGGAARSFYRLD